MVVGAAAFLGVGEAVAVVVLVVEVVEAVGFAVEVGFAVGFVVEVEDFAVILAGVVLVVDTSLFASAQKLRALFRRCFSVDISK